MFGDDYPTPDGTCVRDYVHVADLSDAHVLALEALPAVQGAFNLGTGRGDSVKRVLDAVSRVTGLELHREVAGRRAGDPPALVAERAAGGGAPRLAPAAQPGRRRTRRVALDAGASRRLRRLTGAREQRRQAAPPVTSTGRDGRRRL